MSYGSVWTSVQDPAHSAHDRHDIVAKRSNAFVSNHGVARRALAFNEIVQKHHRVQW